MSKAMAARGLRASEKEVASTTKSAEEAALRVENQW